MIRPELAFVVVDIHVPVQDTDSRRRIEYMIYVLVRFTQIRDFIIGHRKIFGIHRFGYRQQRIVDKSGGYNGLVRIACLVAVEITGKQRRHAVGYIAYGICQDAGH